MSSVSTVNIISGTSMLLSASAHKKTLNGASLFHLIDMWRVGHLSVSVVGLQWGQGNIRKIHNKS